MNGKIVYDKPGRIRFRCGAYAFERELETAIQEALLRNRFVLQVEVHAQNGGIWYITGMDIAWMSSVWLQE